MKRPHTYFSTEFHGGPRAVRARLGNLFAAPRRSGRLLLLCTVLLWARWADWWPATPPAMEKEIHSPFRMRYTPWRWSWRGRGEKRWT